MGHKLGGFEKSATTKGGDERDLMMQGYITEKIQQVQQVMLAMLEIQESHLMFEQGLCGLVENALCKVPA
jgi:hypothetical protein